MKMAKNGVLLQRESADSEPSYKTQHFTDPVKIIINSYPNYLDGSVVVQIK